ncbi:hypothetical protein FACS1894147_09770 [Spirochaetia bacterium]|nr:hypothetical protein FACS1894147_09770 [Spirochaetia bacterium]
MKKYQSELARSIHEEAEGFYRAGLIDTKRMHEYDVDCLVPACVPNRETFSTGGESHRSPAVPQVAAGRDGY